ncbi:hypothetical protein Aab01nite_82010 [Paractinoplanes abujensis]|uniref:Uncharacterized protein n=1 Tax=Paractinoplanes abujensis TaxID=882441 RepID=A0A7W7CRK8_9ACTN|nr:hypothetical protein [Actinoplanes abujensis]MBB4693407.1 hypothetical protein [Actinoplanes abujensis]GID24611.1 hypothetical protein Aab01nite_82010 [Actinoplanes abujensis]
MFRTHAHNALLVAGVALTMCGCGSASPTDAAAPVSPEAPASATTAPTTRPAPEPTTTTGRPTRTPAAGSGGDGPILSGRRQVAIRPAGGPEGVLAVDGRGRLNLTDGGSDFALFVLVPVRDGLHQIRTARAGAGGEPSCMGVKNNGADPLTVVAAACDTRRAGQLFRVRTAPEASADGYGISNQGAYLQISPERGLIAEELSDAPLRTVYTFVDNGAAPAQPGS